ncbi:MAG: hypothetical protein IT384_01810 [Deltaproteobacteria bacterium]|nr:hypothetical protein [Deltaproteobacteria bacterium]
MPGFEHEAELLLLRLAPELVLELVPERVRDDLPVFETLRPASNDLGASLLPTRLPDLVLVARDEDGKPVLALVVEVQRSALEDKPFIWPQYLASAHALWRCTTGLVVITDQASIAQKAKQPIATLLPFHPLAPWVVGPDDIPKIVDPEDAGLPELAVLSAFVHGGSDEGAAIFVAAMAATDALDSERQRQYLDLLMEQWPEVGARAMEAIVESGKYEYRSEFARRYYGQGLEEGKAEGRAQGREQGLRSALLTVLSSRAIPLSSEARARIEGEADVDRLERWVARSVRVARAEDLFDGEA